jgi:RND family efflux transporter MFP subunit
MRKKEKLLEKRCRRKVAIVGALAVLLWVGALVLGGSGCERAEISAGPPIVAVPPPIVQVAKPARRTVERTLQIPGDVEPYQQAMLYAKVAGYLRSVLVDKGSRVKAGILLATIDSPEMRREAAQAQGVYQGASALAAGNAAARARALSEYHQAQAAYAKAQSDLAAVQAQVPKARAERETAAAEYQKAIEQEKVARTGVTEAQAALKQAQVELELNQQTYSRLKQVYDRDPGLLARQDLDIAQTRWQVSQSKVTWAEQAVQAAQQGVAAAHQGGVAAQSKVNAAERAIDVAKAQVRTAEHQATAVKAQIGAARSQVGVVEAQGQSVVFQSRASQQAAKRAAEMLAYTEIRAPFAGTITQRFLDPGALVQSAANSAQGTTKPVLALADSDTVRVYVQVPEPDVPHVHPGTRAKVRADALPNHPFPARVTRVAGALDLATRTMLTEIDLPNHAHLLTPGMTVKVTLDLEAHAGALTVPTSAVAFDKEKRSVFIAESGKARKVNVKTGFEGPQWIEITGGLSGDEDVIATGKENVSNGGAVQVQLTAP